MIVSLGEILFDVYEDEKRIGGAPFNFAYHLNKMGLPVHLATRVGEDPDGREIRKFVQSGGFHSLDVQRDRTHPTGTVRITVDTGGHPEFDIVADAAYDHLEITRERLPFPPDAIDLIYYGTLVQRTPKAFTAVQNFLKQTAESTRRFFDINLRPHCFNAEVIHESLKTADILKLNEAELVYLGETLYNATEADRIVDFLMHNFEIEIVALTLGEAGSVLYTQTGCYRKPAPPIPDIRDTVGAGDAFAAVLARGILESWPPERILEAATLFAADICRIDGAIPSDATVYDRI